MNCRGCGRRIPESYLRQDSFECPYCGRRYRRTAAKAANNADAMRRRSEPASRSRAMRGNIRPVTRRNTGVLEKIKRIALRRVWKLPLIAWTAVILLVGIAGNSAFEDHETEEYAQLAAENAQVKTEIEQSVAATESATEAPVSTVTEAPEMTVTPTVTAVTAVNMVSTDSLRGMIESVVAQNFEHYNVSAKDDIITVNLWQEGIAAALALSTATGSNDIRENWDYLKQSMTSLAGSICGLIDTAGRDDVVLNLNVLNDQNLDNVLLTIYETYIVYDALGA